MIKCGDSSQISGTDDRILCVEQVSGNEKLLAFWPDRASHETVWLSPDDVAELAKRIGKWAKDQGGVAYAPTKRKVTGDIDLTKSF